MLKCTQDGATVFPLTLFACGIKLIKHIVNPANGTWLQHEDFHHPSLIRRPSARLLHHELSRLRGTICAIFPAFFSPSGLRSSNHPLNSDSSLSSPYTVRSKDNTALPATNTKLLYSLLNQSINCPHTTSSTYWHDNGTISPTTVVNWTEIYKTPSSKKDGDVQFKLLHNVLPSLTVLHHFNPDISSSCGWCGERGTIHHLFIRCPFIQPALDLLHHFISRLLPGAKIDFDLYWTLVPHARGRHREAVGVCNFLITSLKSTIYWLYRTSHFLDPVPFWTQRIKSKIYLDYEFNKLQNNTVSFCKRWSFDHLFFRLDEGGLTWCF